MEDQHEEGEERIEEEWMVGPEREGQKEGQYEESEFEHGGRASGLSEE